MANSRVYDRVQAGRFQSKALESPLWLQRGAWSWLTNFCLGPAVLMAPELASKLSPVLAQELAVELVLGVCLAGPRAGLKRGCFPQGGRANPPATGWAGFLRGAVTQVT